MDGVIDNAKLVVENKQLEANSVAVISRDKGELGVVEIDAFIEDILQEVKNKSL